MKHSIFILIIAACLSTQVKAQEKFGNTLNVGLGVGYFGTGATFNLNYEFDVFRNFTLAPFIGVSTYRDYRYWGDTYSNYHDYYYRETFIPVGVKGTYYFDELLKANDKWDFYAGVSLGVTFRTVHWDNGYTGDRSVSSYSPLYANLHIGSEYHFRPKTGVFLDLSTGFSTIGLAFHL